MNFNFSDDIDDLLMTSLRVKKFSMQKAYESFEFTILFIKSHPDWYINLSPADYEFTNKPNSPLLYLKNRDAEGRIINIQKFKYYDNFEAVEFFRRSFMTTSLIFFDKDVQLNGVVAIFDFRDVNLGKMRKIPVQVINDALRSTSIGLVQLKQLNIIGMPSFLKPIFELAKAFMSAKIIQRINFINDVKELSRHMDVSVLPKEYGGSSDELMDYEPFKLGTVCINKFNKFDVNFGKIQEHENVGSFRKLEID